uniref:Uncharacterized protein n=3 Tax=Aegilops tauschii TaxID=37682 RepID=A0A453H8P1_AEGTS
ANAFLTAMDFKRRIREALLFQAQPGQQLSDQDLYIKYIRIFLTAFGYEEVPYKYLEYKRRECIVHITQTEGVGYDTSPMAGTTSKSFRQRVDPPVTLKMGKVFCIKNGTHHKRLELIVRLIAGGFALIGDIPAGRTMDLVNGHEIYDVHHSVDPNHCVVLMGSGVEDYPSIPNARNQSSRTSWPAGRGARIYLRARGTWDDHAHPQSSLVGRGGDFNIWADQVSDVWGFYLSNNNP